MDADPTLLEEAQGRTGRLVVLPAEYLDRERRLGRRSVASRPVTAIGGHARKPSLSAPASSARYDAAKEVPR